MSKSDNDPQKYIFFPNLKMEFELQIARTADQKYSEHLELSNGKQIEAINAFWNKIRFYQKSANVLSLRLDIPSVGNYSFWQMKIVANYWKFERKNLLDGFKV